MMLPLATRFKNIDEMSSSTRTIHAYYYSPEDLAAMGITMGTRLDQLELLVQPHPDSAPPATLGYTSAKMSVRTHFDVSMHASSAQSQITLATPESMFEFAEAASQTPPVVIDAMTWVPGQFRRIRSPASAPNAPVQILSSPYNPLILVLDVSYTLTGTATSTGVGFALHCRAAADTSVSYILNAIPKAGVTSHVLVKTAARPVLAWRSPLHRAPFTPYAPRASAGTVMQLDDLWRFSSSNKTW